MPRSERLVASRFAALALAAAASLAAGEAGAYCLTSSCNDKAGQLCTPSSPADCGIPVRWRRACFGWSIQEDASRQVDLATAEALMAQAFAAWTEAPCAQGGTPSIGAINLGPVECDQQEYNQEDGNANAVIFRDEEWPYAGQGNTLALTTVTYNLDDGEIYDADLEVNASPPVQLTLGDADVQHDLASILTHEAGHMLGIAHSPVTGATMTVEYLPGDTSLRDLHPDDVEAICAHYPPDANPGTCDPTPRRGFQEDCGGPIDRGDDCGCRVGPAPFDRGRLFALAALATVLGLRRSRRR
jgi:hypothetical protein